MKINNNSNISFKSRYIARPATKTVVKKGKKLTKTLMHDVIIHDVHNSNKALLRRFNNWFLKGKYGLKESYNKLAKKTTLIIDYPLHHSLRTNADEVIVNDFIKELHAPNAIVRIKNGMNEKRIIAKEIELR